MTNRIHIADDCLLATLYPQDIPQAELIERTSLYLRAYGFPMEDEAIAEAIELASDGFHYACIINGFINDDYPLE